MRGVGIVVGGVSRCGGQNGVAAALPVQSDDEPLNAHREQENEGRDQEHDDQGHLASLQCLVHPSPGQLPDHAHSGRDVRCNAVQELRLVLRIHG